uniref:Zinc finger protein 358 n=1 Tax=Zeugodacus cucurbitae TaxID=28588 RepID=A0A0A1X2S3_ZEUCU
MELYKDCNGACAIATPPPTMMSTLPTQQQRIKCGEVYIWDCVGELFAIECLLCEEHPLCSLSEFPEHMDVWHYDWTAEAHASLPDTTTTEDSCELLPQQWMEIEDSIAAEAVAATTESRLTVLSDSNNSAYNNNDSETVTVASDLPETGSWHTATVLESDCSAVDVSSSDETFEAQLYDAEVEVCGEVNDLRSEKVCVEEVQKSETEELAANSAHVNTMDTIVKKRVENPLLKRLRTEKLIEVYEKFPELWHKEKRGDQKTEAQAKAYRSISQKLKKFGINLKAAAVQRRLNALRKRYRLEKLEELKTQLKGQTYESSFEFYAHLQFLREHIEPQLCKICRRICKDPGDCCEGGEEGRTEENAITNETVEDEDVAVEGKEDNHVFCGAKEKKQEESMEERNEGNCEVENLVNEITLQLSKSAAQHFEVMVEEILKSEDVMQKAAKLEANTTELKNNEVDSIVESTNKLQEELTYVEQSTRYLEPRTTLQENRKADENPNEPNAPRRSLRKRNKIQILEVLELPRVKLFQAQEPEVSTSTPHHQQAVTVNEVSSFDADENMASEEYDSSNGDSGILHDYVEQTQAAPQYTEETESYARLTAEQAQKLIELYSEYPMLWDPDHADFKSRVRRRNVWRQITAQFNAHYQMCYTWVKLHRKMHDYIKYYRRERQRIELEGGCTRWCFYDNFAFLNEVLAEQCSDAPKLLLNKQQNLKIIEVYAAHPQLWNTNNELYKRRRMRSNIFKAMSEQLRDVHNINISALKLKQRIVEFRCTYRLEKERRCTTKLQGGTYEPCYEYYQLLNFLDEHIAPFNCDECGAQYKKHTEIERHMRQAHSNGKNKTKIVVTQHAPRSTASEKPTIALENICHICGMSFTLSRNLLCHLKRHSNQRQHMCAYCPKKFFDGPALRVHERSHTQSRPFVCEQCGVSYATGSKLNQHLKRHSGRRDFLCELCDKAFYTAFDCERHMRTHMNIREKVCPICGKDFGVGSSYYAHMLLHSAVKRYKCKMCCKQFAQFAGLYKHRKRYHPKEFAMERAKKSGRVMKNVAE